MKLIQRSLIANMNLMNMKKLTQIAIVALAVVFSYSWMNAQTFNGSATNTAGNSFIPSTGTGGCGVEPQTLATGGTTFNNDVSGLAGNTQLDEVLVNLTHTWDGDLEIYLQAPNGELLELSTNNGSSADNYTNTMFRDDALNNITAGAPPYTGAFKPEGTLTAISCGPTMSPNVTTLGGFTPGQNGTWQLRILDSAGGDSGAMSNWSMTFVSTAPPDTSPCVMTCPPDVTINLDPGACNAIVNYPNPSLTGGCPMDVQMPASITQNSNTMLIQDALACTGAGDSHWRAYDLGAMGVVGDFTMESLGMASWSAGTVQVFVYSYTGDVMGQTLDPSLMTLIGQSDPAATGAFNFPVIDLTAPLLIPAGTNICVEQRVISAPGTYTVAGNYSGNTQPAYIQAAPCGAAIPTSYVLIGFGNIAPVQVLNGTITVQNAALVQTSGLPSGSTFPIGTTTNCFNLIDLTTGEVAASCCFDVNVNEYSGQILTALACNDLVQVSLDQNCEAIINADVILEGGPYHCYDDYLVYVDQYGYGNNVNTLSLNYTPGLHTVTILDPDTGNSCWGQILVEDKLPPTLMCTDYTLSCGQDLTPVFTPPIMGTYTCSEYPGLPIGPNAGTVTTSTCTVSLPQGVVIVDVNVCVKITHTFIGDCYVQLINPAGAVTDCWGFGQCGGTQNMWQKFDDQGPQIVQCTDINNGCDFLVQPVATQLGTPSLNQYIGTNPNGTWTLMVTDIANADGGTLDEWHLEIQYDQNAPFAPGVSDNCDQNVTLAYNDVPEGDLCDTTVVHRTWTATDDSGNTSQCVQNLTLKPLSLTALQCPANYIGSCGQSSDPSVTGWPTIDGVPITEGGVCNIYVGYWDHELLDCGAGTKIVRTWTVLDWCTQEVEECAQVIKLADDQAPILVCPADQTIGTDPWYCNKDVNLGIPEAYDACGTSFTLTPSVDAGTLVHFGGDNWRIDNLPVGTHTVTWTATDACGNVSTCTYHITVVDDVPPVPVCDEHTVLTLATDDGLQEGLTKIYATTFDDGSYDNCGPVTFLARRMDSCIDFDWIGPNGEYPNNDGGLPESIDKGLTFQPWVPFACCDVGNTVMVELRVTDQSGNINSCMVEVDIQDKLPPYITCPPDITVSCDYWFDGHETNGFEDADGLEDIFGRVLDAYDYDESDRADIIINDPGNNTVSQPHNWGKDGWADDNCNVDITVRTRIFDDCSGETLPSGGPAHAVRLVERTFRAQDGQGNTSTCRQRVWVEDFDPFYITDTQCGLNNADDVRWPCDLTLTDCPAGPLTPENLSAYAPNNKPIVNDDNCSIVGVTYDDQIFYFVDNACYKIIRTWAIIDWCQYDPVEHTGYWTYVQVIKVHDQVGPQFENCPDGPITLCTDDPNVDLPANNQVFLGEDDPNSSACSVHVKMTQTVQEMCSDKVIYDVKIYPNNGSDYVLIVAPTEVAVDSNGEAVLTMDTRQNSLPSNHPIRKYGLPYNDKVCSNWPLPGGTKDYHKILWSVEDGCGNQTTCQYLFRLEDCKKPSPVCVGLSSVVMPSSGCVTIWAKDFDASSFDDCTAHDDLLFSFSGDTYQPSQQFCCEDIAANGSPSFLVQIWAADEGNDQNCNGFVNPLGIEWSERNKDYCTTFVVIDDNAGVCGDSLMGGVIETEEQDAVAQATVTLSNQLGQVMSTFVTTQDGIYHFLNPLIGYSITSERLDNPKNGVSTLDLVLIQKHLLGLQQLDSPYKLIAADANNSQSVSALDLVEIRKLILGLYTEFPNNKSWRFVDGNYVFPDPSHPWPFDEVVDVDALTMGHNFVGVKVGDVNGNVVANATQVQTRNAKGVLELTTAPQDVVAGQTVTVPVSGANFADILGYQFTLQTAGLTLTGVEPGALDMTKENVGVFPGAVTVSWNKAVPVSATDVLFTLTFTATESGSLSEMLHIMNTTKLTDAEAYNGSEEMLDVALTFRSGNVATGKDFALFQNEPNPFAGATVIGFTLPEAMDATLTIFDVTGKVIRTIEGSYAAGYNEVKVNRKDLASSGVMYYRLDAKDFTATKKMVIIE